MRARTAAAVLAVLGRVGRAIVITQPNAVTVWSQTGESTARIEWSLLPATFPPPATQFFDIYIRNGDGGLYNPSLNLLLASGVDSTASTFLNVADAEKFIPGPGYQLFFSDPANPATVYCDSDPFAIGSFGAGGDPPSSTSAASAEETSCTSSTAPEASSSFPPEPSNTSSSSDLAGASSSDSPSATSSGMATSVTSGPSSSSPSASSPSSAPRGGITAAPVPGGPDQQGFNLVPNGGAPRPVPGAGAALAGAVAVVVGAAVLL
ncbi:hypothetical protein JCM3770_004847 [Rhodotorula araucariae]